MIDEVYERNMLNGLYGSVFVGIVDVVCDDDVVVEGK